ncbi:hypothetical protein ACQJBY_051006 [Aegilops geniculata]
MAYSMTTASKGSVILPSHVSPNSSWGILSSSPKIVLLRQVKENLSLLALAMYTAQWPLSMTCGVMQPSSVVAGYCPDPLPLPHQLSKSFRMDHGHGCVFLLLRGQGHELVKRWLPKEGGNEIQISFCWAWF